MNEEEQVELLSGVDIFEDLPKEEVREIFDDLLRRNAEINLGAGEVFYTPRQPDGKLFILIKGGVRIYKMEAAHEFTLEVVEHRNGLRRGGLHRPSPQGRLRPGH